MTTVNFELNHPPGAGVLVLGALTGHAEMAVTGTGAADAIALIDAMALRWPQAVARAADLTVSDRDRLMAAVYAAVFGRRIAGTSECVSCAERFDFDFALDDLIASVTAEPAKADADGWYIDGDTRFRLPTGRDELAAQGRPADQAAEVIALACAPGAAAEDRARIERSMARIAPLIDLSLQAPCPECGTPNTMRFAAERYCLTAMLRDRHRLMREVHLLGAAYHWPLADILSLARDDRRALAQQIAIDREGGRRAGAA